MTQKTHEGIRLEALQLAVHIATQKVDRKRQDQYEAARVEGKLPDSFSQFPTVDNIIASAEKLVDFISK